MTAPGQPNAADLPAALTRPLWGGFALVAVFLLSVVLWSVYAPLATSVQAAGHLVALRPSFEIQHPFGGRIGQVFADEHQEVAAGDLLLRMDSAPQEAQLQEISAQIGALGQENEAARAFLRDPQAAAAAAEGAIAERFAAMYRSTVIETEGARAQAEALRRQAEVLQARVTAGQDQRASMLARFERQHGLVQKGRFRAAEQDALFETLMALEGELSSDAAEIIGLGSQAGQAVLRAAGAETKFRSDLLSVLAGNEKRLPDLRRQQIDLETRILAAEIRAPFAGVVTGLSFSTRQMYAPRGETLMVLTGTGRAYQAAFTVPPHLIDQLDEGMEGTLALTGLPQRNLPRVRAVVLSLSPSARRDSEGAPVGYDGLAELNAADLAALRAAAPVGARFSIDMPLTLTFPGREVTFFEYLVAPFFGFLGRAMQD